MNFENFTSDVTTQTIYLDKTGQLQNSCDTLFSTVGWQRDTILLRFPLLKSIFAGLASMCEKNQPIHIPKVESETGFYDFSFVCLQLDGKDFIRWVIYDYTQKYSQLRIAQQSKHNAFLAKDKKL